MSSAEVAAAQANMSTTVDKTKMYVSMDQSKAYSEYRPRYSEQMFKYIVDYCKQTNPNLNLAVDVGCGPGSSTTGFAKYFKKVIGVDVSETQIACSPKDIPNMEFKVGYSDKLPFIKSGSVDLFCSGESFNLMPHKETFAEADRVLKPGGTIALFGYNTIRATEPEIDAVIQKMYVVFLPYWPKESMLIFEKFRSITLPYPEYTRNEEMVSTQQITLQGFMGLIRSMWPFVAYCKEHPEENYGEKLEQSMVDVIKKVNGPNGGQSFEINYDLFVLMGHKPKN